MASPAPNNGQLPSEFSHLELRANLAKRKLQVLRGQPPMTWESVERMLASHAVDPGGQGQRMIKRHHGVAWQCQNERCGWVTEPRNVSERPKHCRKCKCALLVQIEASLCYLVNPGAPGAMQDAYSLSDFHMDFNSWAALVTGVGEIAPILDLWARGSCMGCRPGHNACGIVRNMSRMFVGWSHDWRWIEGRIAELRLAWWQDAV